MQGEREREGVRRRRVVSKHTGSHFSSQGSFFTMKFFSLSFSLSPSLSFSVSFSLPLLLHPYVTLLILCLPPLACSPSPRFSSSPSYKIWIAPVLGELRGALAERAVLCLCRDSVCACT